jgi:Pyridoxal-phosphate dependent enzyme
MGRSYNNIVETVGRTALVRLNRVSAGLGVDPAAPILLQCEIFNPLGSVKDRIGLSMFEDAERRGVLKQDTVIIERPTATPASCGWPWVPVAQRRATVQRAGMVQCRAASTRPACGAPGRRVGGKYFSMVARPGGRVRSDTTTIQNAEPRHMNITGM